MHLAFDIFQGLGIAAAVGIRPFLPSLVVGGLAAGDVEIDFNHTHFSFLESLPFLLAMAVVGLLLLIGEVRFRVNADTRTPRNAPLALVALALGALLFAASLARGHYAWWPGLIGGVACAALGIVATHPLFARVRARLDVEAGSAVPLYAEAVAIVFAALSVLAPPVGVIVVLALGWLLVAGRRRADQKYAGLRILR